MKKSKKISSDFIRRPTFAKVGRLLKMSVDFWQKVGRLLPRCSPFRFPLCDGSYIGKKGTEERRRESGARVLRVFLSLSSLMNIFIFLLTSISFNSFNYCPLISLVHLVLQLYFIVNSSSQLFHLIVSNL